MHKNPDKIVIYRCFRIISETPCKATNIETISQYWPVAFKATNDDVSLQVQATYEIRFSAVLRLKVICNFPGKRGIITVPLTALPDIDFIML